jgi:hypothetical protein
VLSFLLDCRAKANDTLQNDFREEIAMPSAKAVSSADARRKPLVRRRVIEHRYRISPRTLDNWMKERRIPFYKIRGLLFFSIQKCDAALERFEIKPV